MLGAHWEASSSLFFGPLSNKQVYLGSFQCDTHAAKSHGGKR